MALRHMSFCPVRCAWASECSSASACRAIRCLPGDPVNLALIGTLGQLRGAFAHAGWSEADRLGLASSWRMVRAFVLNQPYPTAPFSTLYLFGRGQDIGFQKAIDDSPRKRHHVRFWAMSAARAQQTVGTAVFWLNTDRPSAEQRVLWVGAGTKDTGFSLTRLTFQVTHATDADTNAERDYIVAELSKNRVIGDVTLYRSGDEVGTDRVNQYIADGDVAVATLAADIKTLSGAGSAAKASNLRPGLVGAGFSCVRDGTSGRD
jgi:LssY C-terminus